MQTENMIINYRYKAECEEDDVLILCVLTRNNVQMFSNFYLFPFLLCFIILFFQTESLVLPILLKSLLDVECKVQME